MSRFESRGQWFPACKEARNRNDSLFNTKENLKKFQHLESYRNLNKLNKIEKEPTTNKKSEIKKD